MINAHYYYFMEINYTMTLFRDIYNILKDSVVVAYVYYCM